LNDCHNVSLNTVALCVCDRIVERSVGIEWLSQHVAQHCRRHQPHSYQRRICKQFATFTTSHQASTAITKEN